MTRSWVSQTNLIVTVLVAVGIAAAGCQRSEPPTSIPMATEQVVRATAAPIGSLARDILGDRVPVEMLCPPGQSPGSWTPSPEVVAKYQQARLIVANGAGFEGWVRTAPLPRSRLVVSAGAIEDELIVVKGQTHSHGPNGAHAHDVAVGHTWIDPVNAIAQVRSMTDAFVDAFPEYADATLEDSSRLELQLRSLHERLAALSRTPTLIAVRGTSLAYLARRYDWDLTDPGGDSKEWEEVIRGSGGAPSHRAEGPTVLITNRLPEPSVQRELQQTQMMHLVLWESGELESDRAYVHILENNIDRLKVTLDRLDPP